MGLQRDQNRDDAHVEAIDLTLSSPEPESRPQQRSYTYRQQQHSARTMKEEPRSSHRSMHSSSDHAQRHGSTRTGNFLQQQQRRIDPQHIKQIIDTSDHRALRTVVLQLCTLSPALSGALVRGLTTHSPWAQATMSRHKAKSQTQTRHTSKTELIADEQDARERMKKRLGVRDDSQSSASRSRTDRPSAGHEDRDHLRLPPISQKVPTVKREHRASPTDSDDSTNIVDFPAIARDARKQEPSRHATAQGSSRHQSIAHQNTERLVAHDDSAHNSARDQNQKLCSQCGELYEEGEVRCDFHPGREGPTRPGDIPQFTCCNKFVGEPGCKVGRHTSEKTGPLTNTKRPSPSPGSSSPLSKKPRVL